jgi:hypothetical protein
MIPDRFRIRRALLPVTLLALAACAYARPVQTTFNPAYPERNAAGDPIVAVFEGIVPCKQEGCGRRKVGVVLYGRDAGATPTTYWMASVSVGLGNDSDVRRGRWRFGRGGPGNGGDGLIILDTNANADMRYLWQAGDTVALLLDEKLQPLPGDGVYTYALNRDCRPYGPRTYPIDRRTGEFADVGTDYGTCAKLAGPAS